MKANELRIGNYLPLQGVDFVTTFKGVEIDRKDSGGVIIVTAENFASILRDIEKRKGITLTEEWLLRLGFGKTDDHGFRLGVMSLFIDESSKGQWLWSQYWEREKDEEVEIGTIHQLQNLYFALTGEELTLHPQVNQNTGQEHRNDY